MRTLTSVSIAAVFVLLSLPAAAQDAERSAPRYMAAIDAELDALSIPHSCETITETRARCAFSQRGPTSERELNVHLIYSDETDTMYLYVARLVNAPPDAPATAAVLRRLMELNWALLVGKLEWNGADGEVRLSMVLNTDSNFDRRAFRSLVRQIAPLADRYADELSRLSAEE